MKSPHPDDLRDEAMFVYESFLNEPYLWGGSGIDGVDCSGLALEGLKAVGLAPREKDYSAGGILTELFPDLPRAKIESELKRGMFVFWANPDGSIRHVEIVHAIWMLQGGRQLVLTIGASGGGSRTVDRAEAKRTDARVKIRRITPGWHVAIDPFIRWPSA
jgi:cell wall-associated NlpC family hydrolase